MPIDPRWEELEQSDWEAFAQEWIAALRGSSGASGTEESVVLMNFTAKPEQQWQFILAAVAHAAEEELSHIAAGPMEHLLSRHGDRFIDEVERRAAADPKFAQMLSGVWKNMMTDEVWARVQALKRPSSNAS